MSIWFHYYRCEMSMELKYYFLSFAPPRKSGVKLIVLFKLAHDFLRKILLPFVNCPYGCDQLATQPVLVQETQSSGGKRLSDAVSVCHSSDNETACSGEFLANASNDIRAANDW